MAGKPNGQWKWPWLGFWFDPCRTCPAKHPVVTRRAFLG